VFPQNIVWLYVEKDLTGTHQALDQRGWGNFLFKFGSTTGFYYLLRAVIAGTYSQKVQKTDELFFLRGQEKKSKEFNIAKNLLFDFPQAAAGSIHGNIILSLISVLAIKNTKEIRRKMGYTLVPRFDPKVYNDSLLRPFAMGMLTGDADFFDDFEALLQRRIELKRDGYECLYGCGKKFRFDANINKMKSCDGFQKFLDHHHTIGLCPNRPRKKTVATIRSKKIRADIRKRTRQEQKYRKKLETITNRTSNVKINVPVRRKPEATPVVVNPKNFKNILGLRAKVAGSQIRCAARACKKSNKIWNFSTSNNEQGKTLQEIRKMR